MTTYRTGNAISSADPRDLYDNAENLDELVNSQDKAEHPDRLGVPRKTWHGMEQDFQAFLQSSGYQDLGDYAPGIEITARNQVIRADGELWRLSASVDLPYTTTGAGMPEGGAFVSVGDAALRQELADGTAPVTSSTGEQTLAEALDSRIIQVSSVTSLLALDPHQLRDGLQAQTKEYHPGENVGGALYYWDSSADGAAHNGITVLSPNKTFPLVWFNEVSQTDWYSSSTGLGCWVKSPSETLLASQAGVYPSSSEDQTVPVQAFLNISGSLTFDRESDIYVQRIDARSDSDIDLNNSTIRKLPGEDAVDHLLRFLATASNITIKNGTLIGDSLTHLNGTGEGVHNIFFYPGSSDITITDVVSNEAFGDGVYLGDFTQGVAPVNITLERVSASRCRRQGLSVTAADGLRLIDCKFSEISDDYSPWPLPNGPWAGVDIEPNDKFSILKDIYITNLKTENCKGYGLMLYLATKFRALSEPEEVTITVDGHKDVGSKGGLYVLGGSIGGNASLGGGPNAAINGAVQFFKQLYINNRESAITVRHWTDEKAERAAAPRLKMFSPVIRNYNREGIDQTTASGIVLYNNPPSGNNYGSMSGVEIYYPVINQDPNNVAPGGFAIYAGNAVEGREVRNCNIYVRKDDIEGRVIAANSGKITIRGDRDALTASSPSTIGFGGALATLYTVASGGSVTVSRQNVGATATVLSGGSITINSATGISLRTATGAEISSATIAGSGHSATLRWMTETVVMVQSEYGNLSTT